jgi:RNA polymerase sigma-70 factor (ECF subfamily)
VVGTLQTIVDDIDYEKVVERYHEDLYRFALSLVGNTDAASELTQESYCRLLASDHTLNDVSRVKSWLFTTLYRIFLGQRNHATRFPHVAISSVEHELPSLAPDVVQEMDGGIIMKALLAMEVQHRAPLSLFYLQNLSYREIADALDIPVGTVMSRLSRGKEALREILAVSAHLGVDSKIRPVNFRSPSTSS